LTPGTRISFVVVSSAAWPRAQIETAAPAPANASAIDRPIPLLLPVTKARLLFKLICINSFLNPPRDAGAKLHIFAIDNGAGTTLTHYRRSRTEEHYAGAVFDRIPRRKFGFVLSGTQGDKAFYE